MRRPHYFPTGGPDWRAIFGFSTIFLAATVGIFCAGGPDQGGLGILFSAVGLSFLVFQPRQIVELPILVAAAAVVIISGLALLPGGWFHRPSWKQELLEASAVPIGGTVALVSGELLFWWSVVAIGGVLFAYLQCLRLRVGDVGWSVMAFSVVAAAYSLLSIMEQASAFSFPLSGGATFGFFPNRNHTTSLLAFGSVTSLGLAFYDFRRGSHVRGSLAAGCLALCMTGMLLFSESRAGVLLLPAAVLIFLFGARRRHMGNRALLVILIFGVAVTYVFVSGVNPARERILAMLSGIDGNETEQAKHGDSFDFRVPVLRDTLSLIGDFPISGVGLGNFQYVFPHYRKASLTESRAVHPESDWMMFIAEVGVLPVTIAVILVSVLIRRLWVEKKLEGWLLRWTLVAGALTVGVHGFFDVPVHRVSLGYFVILALSIGTALPSARNREVSAPFRLGFAFAGLLTLGLGLTMVRAQWFGGGAAPPFRWPAFEERVEVLNESLEFERGEAVARKAVRQMPMRSEPYFWLGAILLKFEDTDEEVISLFEGQRLVDPNWPQVSVNQALLWDGISVDHQVAAWADAIDRALRIDRATDPRNLTTSRRVLADALRASTTPQIAEALLPRIQEEANLLGAWLRVADGEVAARVVDEIMDPAELVVSLPPDLGAAVGNRWLEAGWNSKLLAQMEASPSSGEGAATFWKILARHYARLGEHERAVRLVATERNVNLSARWKDPLVDLESLNATEQLLAKMSHVQNTVAVRRLVSELTGDSSNNDEIGVAVGYHADAGEWEQSWTVIGRANWLK